MAVNGKHLLEKRRQREDACRDMDNRVLDDRKAQQQSLFESSSALKIDHKMRQERMKELRSANERGLEIRRQQLADLYNDEMEGWRSEVMARVETHEDRKARIYERAYALRDARENERRKTVDQKYHEQWRESCDEVRTLDSRALTIHMSKERVQQIKDKINRKQKLTNEENLIMIEWKKQLDEAQRVEDEKMAKQHRADMDANTYIKDQISEKLRRKNDEYQRMQDEADVELRNIREAMRVESERMKRRQADAHFRGKEMNDYNQHFKVLEQEELRIQREHDKILLDYALMKERESDHADNIKKNEIRKSAKQYAEYLKEQAIRESDESAYLDEIHRKEEEKIIQLKDNELKQRNDARNNLMKMVDNGRQEQIRFKNDSVMRERIENRNSDLKYMSDARNAIIDEKKSEMNRRNFNIENNEKLADQILYRREKDEKEKQDVYLADKRMKFIERTQQQKLAEQGGAIRTNFPLKHCDWN